MFLFLPPTAARMDAEVCRADGGRGHSSAGHSETTDGNEGTHMQDNTVLYVIPRPFCLQFVLFILPVRTFSGCQDPVQNRCMGISIWSIEITTTIELSSDVPTTVYNIHV